MKKAIILALGLMAAGSAFAAAKTVCLVGVPQGTTAGGNVLYPFNTAGTDFVVTTFPIKCSNNVDAKTDETAVAFAIESASTKGKNIFQGSSGGGGVKVGRACTGACTAAQVGTGLATLLANATP